MPIDDIARCFTSSRPVASAFLGTASDDAQAGSNTARRWKNLRRELERQGIETDTLVAMDGAVGVDPETAEIGIAAAEDNVFRSVELDGEADHAGGDVLAIVAAGGSVLLRRFLPAVRSQGEVRVGPLPWVTPLLKAQQGVIAHLVVLVDRQGADVWGVDERGGVAVDTEVAGDDSQISLVNQGGWSHRRIHQRAVNRWEANAKEVAAEIADLVRAQALRAVFVAGDTYAVGFFVEALPGDVAPLVQQLESGARGPESGLDGVRDEVQRLLRTIEAGDTAAILSHFNEVHGRQAGGVAGADEVIAALQMATVATLLVAEQTDDGLRAWFGPEPTHVALERSELASMGVDEAEQGPLAEVCVRAALGTGAAVRVVPRHALPAVVGAILRGGQPPAT